MRDGIERGGLLEAEDEVVRQLPRGSAGAVGDGDERGMQRLKVRDVLVEGFGICRGFWREEFEGHGRLIGCKDIADVH